MNDELEGRGILDLSIAAGRWQLTNTIVQQLFVLGTFLALARILPPREFGIASLILLVPTFIDGITTFNLDTSALQKKEAMGRYLNVLWTFNILRVVSIFVLTLALAPFLARYFKIEEAQTALYFAGAVVLMQGLVNIGQNYFFLHFDFRRIFLRDTITKATYAIFSIALALIYHSYWALFLGNILSTACMAFSTYFLHSYRPRFDFRFRMLDDLRHFGQWLYAQDVLQQIERSVGDALIGRFASAAELGVFTKAKSLAQAPSSAMVSAINKVSFTSYIHVRDSRPHIIEGINKTFDILSFVSIPYIVAIWLTGTRIVLVVLGPGWIALAPYLKILVVMATFNALAVTLATAVFNGIGKPKIQSLVTSVYTVVAIAGYVLLIPPYGARGAAYALLSAVLSATCVTGYYLIMEVGINVRRILSTALVVAIASAAPVPLALSLLSHPFFNATSGYILLVALSGLIYAGIIVLAGILFKKGPYDTLLLLARSVVRAVRPV